MLDDFLRENLAEISDISDSIFNNPELGFKEYQTKQTIIDYIRKIDNDIEIKEHTQTGLSITIGSGDKNIALISELDAVYAPHHFNSDSQSGAAHNCGHYSQVAIALIMFKYLHGKDLNNKLTFVFTPAEEFLDLEFRSELMEKGVIKSKSGKIDMILNHLFDDYDLAIGWHSLVSDKYQFDINNTLAGFVYLEYHLSGKPAHAGVEPQKGINSLDFAIDIYQYMREVEKEFGLEQIRINPKINDDDQLNIVSSQTTLKTYVRYLDINKANIAVGKINDFIQKNSKLKGIAVSEHHDAGYFPLIQYKPINDLFINQNKNSYDICQDFVLFAGGDLGDVSYLIPTVQFGYNGFTGNIHGNEFKMTDYEFVFIDTCRAFINLVLEVDKTIDSYELYKRTVDDYKREKFKEFNEK